MIEPAIELKNVFKRFRRGYHITTLAEIVLNAPKHLFQKRKDGLTEKEFWALQDIDLTVAKGETLGIIGHNGAGKSTILKLLFNILRPDRGSVKINGRVGGLIELGAGFHSYLTARENVFINGAILGMNRSEIKERFDAIVEFSELREFLDMPVKNFSSGMHARLAFSIAAHAKPDVLLVDEVLAVGDLAFQNKCYDWLGRMRRDGTTVVMVSHNMFSIAGADRVMHLNAGKCVETGEPRPVIDRYLESAKQKSAESHARVTINGADGKPKAEITKLEVLDTSDKPATDINAGDSLRFRFHYNFAEEIENPILSLTLIPDDARYPLTSSLYVMSVFSADLLGSSVKGKGVAEVVVSDIHIPVGMYRIKTYIFERFSTSTIFMEDGAGALEMHFSEHADGRSLMSVKQEWSMPDAVVAPDQEQTKG
ncbi:MAG: ABC transporter ATP-binding protein [Planctomycetota bacterium]|jgi:ABC-type polysaccharide/polyol phosphate transport system ATPase subunit